HPRWRAAVEGQDASVPPQPHGSARAGADPRAGGGQRRAGGRRRRLLDGGRRGAAVGHRRAVRPPRSAGDGGRGGRGRGAWGRRGAGGAGACELLGVEEGVDLRMGTFSKSLAACGGFIVGPAEVVEYLRISSRAFLFTASGVPAALGAALAALRIVRSADG